MAIVSTGDFVGKFSIVTNGYKITDLELYIERYEKHYLVRLLGKELYDLFIADLEETIQDPIYTKIQDEFTEQSNCGVILESRGLKDMLLGFIYFEWKKDDKVQQTINGAVKINGELSQPGNNHNTNIFGRFNESVDTYKAIQDYCMENLDVYPTFKGVEEGYSYLTW